MKASSSLSNAVAALVFAAFISGNVVVAQGGSASLDDQLKTQMKLTKMGSDSGGVAVVDAGAVFTIQKGGILGVPPASVMVAPATFKDGELHSPGGFAKTMVGPNGRLLAVGEKVYVTKINSNAKNDKVAVSIIECDSCNGVQQPSFYHSQVVFQFPKGYLESADASQIREVISQVLAPDTGSGDQQQAQSQPQPASNQPPSAPPTIQLGQTIDQVQAALGQPEKVVDLGQKQIYVYKDLKVTFFNGKVTDVQ
jgi:hypothetical protein